MSHQEERFLRAEIGTLTQLLAELTDDDLIERIQLTERLETAKARLQEIEIAAAPLPLPITFSGVPVEGSRSIDAGFATQAVKAFVDAIDTVATSFVIQDLKRSGPLPSKGDRSLRIVDTAMGSFGFKLELPPLMASRDEQMALPLVENTGDPYATAIHTTLRLIEGAARDDDETVSDLIAEIHPRAASKIHAFAEVLAVNGARFAAQFEGRRVRLDRDEEVTRVVDSLKSEDIHEEDVEHIGTIIGILPESRAFEARLSIEGETLVKGVIGRSVNDVFAFKDRYEGIRARLVMRVVSVRTRRRHVLVAAEPLDSSK